MRIPILCIALLITVCAVSAVPTAYVAQGDTAYLQMGADGGTCWVFPSRDRVELTPRFDFQSVVSNNETYCPFSAIDTYNLAEGDYEILYTYPVYINGKVIKDVSWKNGSLVSIFNKNPILEDNNKSSVVKSHLIQLMASGGIDRYDEYILRINAPYLTITRQEQVASNIIRVSGDSNLADGTNVTVKVDEWDHYSTHDVANFTFHTTVSKPLANAPGKWSVDMLMPLQDMPAGWHSTNAYAGTLQTTARFPLYQSWEPAPTPTQYINYFGNGSIKPDVVTVEVTKVVIQYQDKWHTPTPTPAITDALGDPVEYPYVPGETTNPIAGVVGMGVIAGLVLWRDYKWK